MIDTELELPQGWVVCKLEDVAMSINSGFASGKHNKSEKGIPHIRPMNIDISGNIDLSVVKYVEDNFKDKLQKNDVLFNNTNSPKLLGKTRNSLKEFLMKSFPLTLITALIFIICVYLLSLFGDFSGVHIILVTFVGLASLTFPHILLEYLIEKNEK